MLRFRPSLTHPTSISGFLEAIGFHSSHCEIETSEQPLLVVLAYHMLHRRTGFSRTTPYPWEVLMDLLASCLNLEVKVPNTSFTAFRLRRDATLAYRRESVETALLLE